MSLDLTGTQNIGEFYSHHYLDALLKNNEATPDRRLRCYAVDLSVGKSHALPASAVLHPMAARKQERR
jgi:hypothetical protein